MTGSSRRLLEGARALPEDERLQLASEILACVEGPPDTDWDASWLAELDRRFAKFVGKDAGRRVRGALQDRTQLSEG